MKNNRVRNAWVAANLRAALLSGAACSVLLLTAPQSRAEEFKIGDFDVNISGAATAGSEIRTAPRDPVLIFAPNGKKMGVPATATSGIEPGRRQPELWPGAGRFERRQGLRHDRCA